MLLKVTYRDGTEKIIDSAILYSLRYKIIKFEQLNNETKTYISSNLNDAWRHKWRLF